MADKIPLPTHKPTLSMPDDQPSYVVGKDTYTFVFTGANTDGAFAFFDGIIPPGGGPPPHCHGYEEMLFVLEGELTVFYEESRTTLTQNAVLNIPAWAPHMLKNFSSSPVRLFCEEGRHFPAGAPLAAALPCNDSCIHCAAACRVRRLQPARCITNAYLWLQY